MAKPTAAQLRVIRDGRPIYTPHMFIFSGGWQRGTQLPGRRVSARTIRAMVLHRWLFRERETQTVGGEHVWIITAAARAAAGVPQ